jgi:hypothetical protein
MMPPSELVGGQRAKVVKTRESANEKHQKNKSENGCELSLWGSFKRRDFLLATKNTYIIVI